MAKQIEGNELGKIICNALGIPTKGVVSVTIKCVPGDRALVTVERSVREDDDLAVALQSYRVVSDANG